MLRLGFLLGVIVATGVNANSCYSSVDHACSSKYTSGSQLLGCDAKYGSFGLHQTELQSYANAHVETSFEYLLMSSHFGSYESNRMGFKDYFRSLSDKTWNNAIDIIKFIAKRGGSMNFNQPPYFKKSEVAKSSLSLNELSSLAKALDTEKQLAEEAFRIHQQAISETKHDASVAHYIAEEFVEKQADTIRTIAGHTNDLKKLMSEKDNSLAVYLFDEYLKQSL